MILTVLGAGLRVLSCERTEPDPGKWIF